jgi:hypothetical protein
MDKLPFELILLLVAAIIGGLNKLMEKLKEMREKTAEEQQRLETRAGVELQEPAVEKPKPVARRREPRQRQPLTIPEFNVPLPLPEALAPKPPRPVAEAEAATAIRRPRPRRSLQLGAEPIAVPRPLPAPLVAKRAAVAHQPIVRTKIVQELMNPVRVRQAIILREVLGPPVALRHRLRR